MCSPSGCTAIIDPDAVDLGSAASQGQGATHLYLVRLPNGTLAIRRVAFGSSSAFISTASYASDAPDEMLPLADLELLGAVIWFQAAVG